MLSVPKFINSHKEMPKLSTSTGSCFALNLKDLSIIKLEHTIIVSYCIAHFNNDDGSLNVSQRLIAFSA